MTPRRIAIARRRLRTGVITALVVGVMAAMGVANPDRAPALSAHASAPREATIDLATHEGVGLVQGQWRYSDTKIVEVDFTDPAPTTSRPARRSAPTTTCPRPASRDSTIQPGRSSIRGSRRAPRTRPTVVSTGIALASPFPSASAAYDPTGATVVFETALDDYAEVWVDGELPRARGPDGRVGRERLERAQSSRHRPRRSAGPADPDRGLRHQRADLQSADQLHLGALRAAAFSGRGATGPMAVRRRKSTSRSCGRCRRIEAIVGANPKLFKARRGLRVHRRAGLGSARGRIAALQRSQSQHHLPLREGRRAVAVFRTPSGYAGADIAEYRQPGSNGLALDGAGPPHDQ